METMEIWKEVRGHLNYAISTQGRVRRLTKGRGARRGGILKPQRGGGGYRQVALTAGGKPATRKVHQLVAAAFLWWPRDGLEVNHKNGIKTDNRLANLELVTKSENQRHAYRTGLRVPNRFVTQVGEQVHNAKLCDDSVREIRTLKASGMSQRAIGDRMGVHHATIGRVLAGRTWAHVAAGG